MSQDSAKLTFDELDAIVVCPHCRAPLPLAEGRDAACRACGAQYAHIAGTWDLSDVAARDSDPKWQAWDVVQDNGLVAYTEEPIRNLSVGDREDAKEFGTFCRFEGVTLDVGCGLQDWPAYFYAFDAHARFVGIDPLIARAGPRYWQFRALAEHLPFGDGAFDRVLFATSLDHFVRPVDALREAGRVCARGGHVVLWVAEKRADAPKPATSPEWYRQLTKPDGADDVFHIERLNIDKVGRFIEEANLRLVERQDKIIDAYRSSHFLRLSPG